MMHFIGLSLIIAIALASGGVASALVVCTAKDGTVHVGDEAAPECAAKGESTGSDPAKLPPVSRPTTRSVPADDNRRRERDAEVDRRRHIQAIAMQRVMNQTYGNARFVQGYVVNIVDFPVYGVQICIDSANACQLMTPSTLQPGAQGAFSFPTNLLGVPDWRVIWDVVPRQ